MRPQTRLQSLWNWLPVFRIVAETQHLPTAAKELAVSASALSRTIRLLEEDLGVLLFRRAGRRIELNDNGQALLTGVREAMRRVDEGVSRACDVSFTGPVHIASAGLSTRAYVAPALIALRETLPDLHPVLGHCAPEEIPKALLGGALDICFLSVPVTHPDLTTLLLGEEPNGVYCAEGHPLAKRTELSLEEVTAYPFTAPVPNAQGLTHEGWPIGVERTIVFYAAQMMVGVQVCREGGLLAVLPEVIATQASGLIRLPLDLIPPTPLYAVFRPGLGQDDRTSRVLAAVQREISGRDFRR